jgi:hypothetical protein
MSVIYVPTIVPHSLRIMKCVRSGAGSILTFFTLNFVHAQFGHFGSIIYTVSVDIA